LSDLPGEKSWSTKVAGYIGGPHQRSSWRGWAHSRQVRSTVVSSSTIIVVVSPSASLCRLVTTIAAGE
jgi:hypothetical protein